MGEPEKGVERAIQVRPRVTGRRWSPLSRVVYHTPTRPSPHSRSVQWETLNPARQGFQGTRGRGGGQGSSRSDEGKERRKEAEGPREGGKGGVQERRWGKRNKTKSVTSQTFSLRKTDRDPFPPRVQSPSWEFHRCHNYPPGFPRQRTVLHRDRSLGVQIPQGKTWITFGVELWVTGTTQLLLWQSNLVSGSRRSPS